VKLSTSLGIRILWERIKNNAWWLSLIALIAFLGYQFTNKGISTPTWLSSISNPVVSSLAGTLLGGAIGFFGSVHVQKRQVRSEAAIRRRDEIYTPLYEELLELRQHLHEKPCPDEFNYQMERDAYYLPKFAVWSSFKHDSRKLQVPKRLAKALDEFVIIIEKYVEAKKDAVRDSRVEDKIKEILRDSCEGQWSRQDIWFLLPCSSNLAGTMKRLETIYRVPNEEMELERTRSDEELRVIADTIYQECSKIDAVKKLQDLRGLLDDRMEELIFSLEKVIRFINKQFEQHEKWF
jgi:hypothetical protein